MVPAALPPLALYVHLPWCVAKCPYCDFNSHAAPARIPAEAYVDALIADLEQARADAAGRPLISVFIGGGTPSLFPPQAIERLLAAVRARFDLPPDLEITLEANPGTLEAERFAGFRAAGVNRLSLGVQSFADAMLTALGRIHDGADAERAAQAARAAGFDHVNLDLMYGLPGQTSAEADADLARAIALGPDHLSWYELTIEPNTAFWSAPPALPDGDTMAGIETAGAARLEAAGYQRYEVSAWAAAAEHRCRHNLNYWQFGDYLGIGAGAHAKITHEDGSIERQARIRAPDKYLQRAAAGTAIAHRDGLAPADAAFEFLLNALRLPQGFARACFEQRTDVPLAWLEEPLAAAEADGLIERTATAVRPTPTGLNYLNDLLARFAAATEQWRPARDRVGRIPVAVE